LYRGFSGGPLLNARGEVIGVNTRGLGHGRAVTVPVATVNRVVEQLLEKGHIARPYLGIAMQPVGVPENMRSKLPAEAELSTSPRRGDMESRLQADPVNQVLLC